jgi:hypothetical protein
MPTCNTIGSNSNMSCGSSRYVFGLGSELVNGSPFSSNCGMATKFGTDLSRPFSILFSNTDFSF